MAVLKTRVIRKALEAKGFQKDDTHHEMYWLVVGGKKTSIRTRISHGASEYDDYLIGQVCRQMKLTKQQFLRFVDCVLKHSQYVKDLVGKKLIQLDDDS